MSISDLNAKITRTSKNDFETLQAVSLYAHDEDETAREKLKSLVCDSGGNLAVSVVSTVLPEGVATEAKQDTMISTLSTSAKQDTTHFLMGLLATKAEQANQSTNLINIDTSTANLDVKITKSAVVASDGTTSAQTVQVCGSNDGTNLRTMSVYDTGELRTVMHGEDHTSNIHPLVVSNSGTLITEIEHSWDTEILENATPLAGGGTALVTGALDLGQGISHEMTEAIFYITNSANMSIDVQPQSSYNGTDWFVSAAGTSVTTTQNKSFMCQNNCFKFGMSPRYMRLRIVNNGVFSTNITVETGRYK